MTEFTYEALNTEQAVIRGRISAESVSAAVSELESQGLQILSIHQVTTEPDTPLSTTDPNADLPDAHYQRVAAVLEKREVIAPGLAALAEELPAGRTRRELGNLVSKLEADTTVEEFCRSEDPSASWLLLLGHGSNSPRFLADLFDEATRESESYSYWNRAFLYPTFVFVGSLAVLVLLCVSVVPAFTSIFDDFDLQLPAMTASLVAISNAIRHSPVGSITGALTVLVFGYTLFRLIRNWGLPGRIGNLLTTGSSWQVTEMAFFTGRLAEALDAGAKLPAALRLVSQAGGRGKPQRLALELAAEAEQEHFSLRESPAAAGLPILVVHALQAGRREQPSIALLRQLSEMYSARVRDRHNWSTGFVAHFAIIGIGLTVGYVVLALFLPLVSLINGLTG